MIIHQHHILMYVFETLCAIPKLLQWKLHFGKSRGTTIFSIVWKALRPTYYLNPLILTDCTQYFHHGCWIVFWHQKDNCNIRSTESLFYLSYYCKIRFHLSFISWIFYHKDVMEKLLNGRRFILILQITSFQAWN